MPQFPGPFTASVQATFQQGMASYQPAGYSQEIAPPGSAQEHYERGNALRNLGRFDEALAAFDGAIALKADYAAAHNGRGIALANLDRPAEAIASFDRAIALDPDYAEAYNNRGNVQHELNRLADALASFDKALALKPDNAWAHNNRGVVLHDAARFDEALASHARAIALKPDYAEAYYNRGIVLQRLNRLDEALADLDKAIALKPGYAAAHNNRGVVLGDLGRLDEALAAYDRAIAFKPDFAEARSNQSHCLLKMGRFAEGWRLHEWRKKTARPLGNRSFAQPLWLGGADLSGKTLFVHCEQGLGDTIQFCRYGKLLAARGASVAMAVQRPLHRLLQQMSPDMTVLGGDEAPAAFDYHCPLLSLPLALNTTLETIPSEPRYIFADARLRAAWDARLPPPTKPRIGIVWSGNAAHKNDHNRSIDLPALAPLVSADAHWISLQKELRQGDAAPLRELSQIVRCGEAAADFSDTAALVDVLDLVIAVDTAVAHLAGAMGKPVWILLPYNADWRWLADRDDSPWYPTARLFRQDATRAWGNVVARVRAALQGFVPSRSRAP